MLAELDKLARAYSPLPGFSFKLLPYRPIYWESQNEKLRRFIADQGLEFDGAHNVFILTCPVITSLTVEEGAELPEACKTLALWYSLKNGDIVHDWQVFEAVCPYGTIEVLWNGYQATRNEDGVPKASDVLQNPMPVPEDADGEPNPTTPPGGKHSRRKSSPSQKKMRGS